MMNTVPDPQPEPRSWPELVRAGRLSEALATLRETAPDDKAQAELLEELIDLRGYLRAKRWSRAETLAQTLAPRSSALTPQLDTQVGLLRRCGEGLERGEIEAALSDLESVTLPLLLAEAATLRGTAQAFLGETEAAEVAFSEALEHDPKHYRAHTNLGNVALEAGRTDEAIAHYERALALNPNFANAHHNLGVAYRRKGQVHKSVQAIRKAQRTMRQADRDNAKESMRSLTQGPRGKYLKWVLWGGIAVGGYLILRALGLI
jgi:tetratricopeptide (TPR) repeat protein